MLIAVCKECAFTLKLVYEWYKGFLEVGYRKEDSPQSGRPAAVCTPDNIRKVKEHLAHSDTRTNATSAWRLWWLHGHCGSKPKFSENNCYRWPGAWSTSLKGSTRVVGSRVTETQEVAKWEIRHQDTAYGILRLIGSHPQRIPPWELILNIATYVEILKRLLQ